MSECVSVCVCECGEGESHGSGTLFFPSPSPLTPSTPRCLLHARSPFKNHAGKVIKQGGSSIKTVDHALEFANLPEVCHRVHVVCIDDLLGVVWQRPLLNRFRGPKHSLGFVVLFVGCLLFKSRSSLHTAARPVEGFFSFSYLARVMWVC